MPLASDGLEGLRTRLPQLLGLASLGGINPGCELLAGYVALVSRSPQTHRRIDAERKALLLPCPAILPSPPLAARRSDFKVESAAVVQPHGLRPGLSGPDRDIGQRHMDESTEERIRR